MTSRYTSFEATAAVYTADTFTFTGNKHDIDVVTENLDPDRGNIYPVTSKGRTPRRKLKGPLKWDGSIETLLYTKHAPSLLYYAMGANRTLPNLGPSAIQTGCFQHEVTSAFTIPDFIMETGRDFGCMRYTGCAATGFSVDFAPDAAIALTVNINGRKEQAQTTVANVTFPDYDLAERAYSGVEIVAKNAGAEGTVASISIVEGANFTYENNFEDSAYTLSSQYLPGLFINQVNLTGSFDISVLDFNQYTAVTADTEQAWTFLADNGSTLTNARGYLFAFPRLSYDKTNLPTTNAERYVQSIDWTANPNVANWVPSYGTDSIAAGNSMAVRIYNAQTAAEFTA